ncbi:Sulfate transport system permease protein CysW [Devosia equisanguinis]|uniref:Sulfate transport system permease protein CysW n=2 Tax=Devosia equisanguinis TaxID=2490941 RepID=A0A447ICY1_9HYPH|nr:Sulfate transport system permease protein CysW [Devosia equisanguinis]
MNVVGQMTKSEWRDGIAVEATQRRSERTGRRFRLPVVALVLVLVVGVPIIWLAIAALGALGSGSNGLTATMLPTALRETGLLMISVGLLAGTAGLVAAWLVTHYEFPLRRIFDWALVLPLAVPTYLAAYSYVEFLDFTGPIQSALRPLIGAQTVRDYWFPDIRSPWGAALVLSAVLYPYTYVACRTFFLMQSTALSIAARTLGANGWRTFLEVVLPVSRPALVVGMTLAMMEVVNDLGAVQYFGINAITAVIYSTWINRSDFGGAAQLAVTVVLVIGLLILAEQKARRNRVYSAQRDSRVPPAREVLTGARRWLAFGFCGGLFTLGFGIPAGELIYLSLRLHHPDTTALAFSALWPTITLAAIGAVVTVTIGLLAARIGETGSAAAHGMIRLSTLGYAIPGTVLALGLLQPLGQADLWFNRMTMALFEWRPGLIISGSMAALIYVYAIRFLAVSHSTLDAAMRKRGRSMLDAGRALGGSRLAILFRIDLPTLSPAILSAATLVFVEIVKELPATLLLRPLGIETLSTLVYSRANVGLFAQAALPALMIVLAGLVPVILASWAGDRRKV